MVRLRRPFPWVAPRACATSARLTARCGGVWRAMAMSLPQGTHRALVGRMLNRATFYESISARRPVDAIIDELLRRGAEEVAELATALFLVVLVHHDNLQAGLERSCSSHVAL
eukprot:scaffold79551_cov62-Phaeocystis_antarctica.AAC.1